MAYTAEYSSFEFGKGFASAFKDKRVLITGSGKDGGIGQSLALAAAANGAAVVGVHFHSSYRDGFDLVDAISAEGGTAFALQADVTSMSELWASRSYVVEQMGNKGPDIIVCNSGLSETGYRFGRALPEIDGESRAERRARVRATFISDLNESFQVLDTKIDGFVSMTHLWAAEAVYHNQPLQIIYISSMQAIEPGIAVPGYVVANWAVLRLPEVLRVNLGRSAELVSSTCLMLPFIRTSMTEAHADNKKVFGRWQPRMLETHEAARSITRLLTQPREEIDLGNFKLNVSGSAENIELAWSRIRLEVEEDALDWQPVV
ncbi:MAG TPA: SDR family NAD(P)-dependent oxidoreductase [Woeseiaceae bacterium]|nr:SDR family NAD(P)-dependent oxidoreductase [Woeseiaceae bacterium]